MVLAAVKEGQRLLLSSLVMTKNAKIIIQIFKMPKISRNLWEEQKRGPVRELNPGPLAP